MYTNSIIFIYLLLIYCTMGVTVLWLYYLIKQGLKAEEYTIRARVRYHQHLTECFNKVMRMK